MCFVKASFTAVGSRGEVRGVALVDSGARYTVIDEGLAGELGVRTRIGHIRELFRARIGRIYPVELRDRARGGKSSAEGKE